MSTRQALFVRAKSFNDEGRLVAMASTDSIDRHGEIVDPAGFEAALPGFMSNPVILAGHQHTLEGGTVPTIGKVVNPQALANGLQIEVEFAPAEVSPLGPQYRKAFELGFLNAFSIGFIPQQTEVRKVDDDHSVMAHTAFDLLEISAVAVPSNRESLQLAAKSFDAGLKAIADDLLEAIGPDTEARTFTIPSPLTLSSEGLTAAEFEKAIGNLVGIRAGDDDEEETEEPTPGDPDADTEELPDDDDDTEADGAAAPPDDDTEAAPEAEASDDDLPELEDEESDDESEEPTELSARFASLEIGGVEYIPRPKALTLTTDTLAQFERLADRLEQAAAEARAAADAITAATTHEITDEQIDAARAAGVALEPEVPGIPLDAVERALTNLNTKAAAAGGASRNGNPGA